MEEKQENLTPKEPEEALPVQETEDTGYVPRPVWQVWAARIGLALFLLVIAMYYINLFRSGR